MRLLDLYCGEGGASAGYARAGFDVLGIDLAPQSRYPFTFQQGNALEVLEDLAYLRTFDAIHASPPCQSESTLRHRTGVTYPNLLGPTLDALERSGVPWVVENVASSRQMPGALVLCGTQFGLCAKANNGEVRHLKRHRRFLASFELAPPAAPCSCRGRLIGGIYGDGGGGQQTRGWRYESAEQMRECMETPWMSRRGMSQAIPPAYSEHVGRQLAEWLRIYPPISTHST